MRAPRRLRLAAGAAAAALVAVALTACSGPAGGGCTVPATGEAAQSVQVSGRFGRAPTVDFPKPLRVDSTQVATAIAGKGARITRAQQVVTDVTLLNASTGAVLTRTEYSGDGEAARFVVGTIGIRGLTQALTCSQVGERLVAVIPAKDGIPAASRPATLGADDSILAVVDVRHAYLARANGVDQVMAGGLPAVVLGPDGRPGITLPEGAPPTTLQIADLKKGSGAVIGEGDNAVVQFTGVAWKAGDPSASESPFQSTWTDGAPTIVPVQNGRLIPGFRKALVGQRVGSQVLAVVPPSQGYGNKASGQIPAGSTLVFVIDILGKA